MERLATILCARGEICIFSKGPDPVGILERAQWLQCEDCVVAASTRLEEEDDIWDVSYPRSNVESLNWGNDMVNREKADFKATVDVECIEHDYGLEMEGKEEAVSKSTLGFLTWATGWLFIKIGNYGGNSLVVQWLGLHTSTAQGPGSIPGQGTKVPSAMRHGKKKR